MNEAKNKKNKKFKNYSLLLKKQKQNITWYHSWVPMAAYHIILVFLVSWVIKENWLTNKVLLEPRILQTVYLGHLHT